MNIPFLDNRKRILVVGLLWLAFCMLCASLYVQRERALYVSHVRENIAQQESLLTSLATQLHQDGADEVVSKLISDCSIENRVQFDEKLGVLHQLKGQELVEMEHLFNACGDFFALRRAVMTAKFEREFEIYQMLTNALLAVHSAEKALGDSNNSWGELVAMEKERSALSTKLVAIQGEIIKALKNKVTISSDVMQVLLVDGQKTNDELRTVTSKIDAFRLQM